MTGRQAISIFLSLSLIAACQRNSPHVMVDMGGYDFHVYDTGRGRPVVVFEAGLGSSLAEFRQVQKKIASVTRVISYDRGGLGESDASPLPRSYENMVKELKRLLEIKKIPPPYILVGHSMGGHLIRLFENLYPEDVAGMVFIDGAHEEWLSRIKEYRTDHQCYSIDTLIRNYYSRRPDIIRMERDAFDLGCEYMGKYKVPADKPVRVITSVRCGDREKANLQLSKDKAVWRELHSEWVAGNPYGRQIITSKSGHYIHITEPGLVISSILEVMEEVENKSHGKRVVAD